MEKLLCESINQSSFFGKIKSAAAQRLKVPKTSFWAKPRRFVSLVCELFGFQIQNGAAGNSVKRKREIRIFSGLQQIIRLRVSRNSRILIAFCPLAFDIVCSWQMSCPHLLQRATSQYSDVMVWLFPTPSPSPHYRNHLD